MKNNPTKACLFYHILPPNARFFLNFAKKNFTAEKAGRQKKMNKIDDGYYSWLVEAADFDSLLEIPKMTQPKHMEMPENLIPFSKMKYSKQYSEYIHFYEHDMVFRNFLQNPDRFIEQIYRFPGIITPDCSLYRDMPLVLQMTNTYMSRAVGCYLQEQGMNVYPNVRWGDERSYTPVFTDTPFAFLGIEKHSIVSVSTYGCIRGKENKKYFHDGFHAMLKYLEPEIVLIHGAMPSDVFCDLPSNLHYAHYMDWTSQKRRAVV